MPLLSALLSLSLLVQPAPADSLRPDSMTKQTTLKKKIGLFRRIVRSFSDIDTLYVKPNYYNFTSMVQNTNYLQNYRLSATDGEGNSQALSMRPSPSVAIGPYFGYQWIFLGYTFDVSHPKSMGKSSEFNLSLYSAPLGCDFVYVKNKGNFRLRRATGFENVEPKSVNEMAFTGMDARTLSFSAYYVFNHRKFSYPATYNQSTVQRRSCGSWMMGAGFSQQHLNFDYTRLPDELLYNPDGSEKIIEELKFSNVNYNYYYLSGGYAYNWVIIPNLTLGASFMPSIGLRKAKGEKLNGTAPLLDLRNFSFDCISRAGIVWNNSRWFVGASFINNLYMYRKKRQAITNTVSFANLYTGIYFHRMKQYRK